MAVERVSRRKARIVAPRRPGDPPVLIADARRARAELGLDFSCRIRRGDHRDGLGLALS